MKLKETRILDAEGARYACIANHYCTRCDCEEYDRILTDADSSSRKPGGITVDDLARIAEAIRCIRFFGLFPQNCGHKGIPR